MTFPQSSGSPHHFLASLASGWTGTSKLWLEPGKLADESPVLGTITLVLEGRFAIYLYQGSIEGEPQHGMFTLAITQRLSNTKPAGWTPSTTTLALCFAQAMPSRTDSKSLAVTPIPPADQTGAGAPKSNWWITTI